MGSERRWPGWVYDGGDEPDYRFSFANERTFLAWVRTSLALLAGGVALHAVTDLPHRRLVGSAVIVLAMISAVLAFTRWAVAERAMRREEPLHGFGGGGVIAIGAVVLAIAMLVVIIEA